MPAIPNYRVQWIGVQAIFALLCGPAACDKPGITPMKKFLISEKPAPLRDLKMGELQRVIPLSFVSLLVSVFMATAFAASKPWKEVEHAPDCIAKIRVLDRQDLPTERFPQVVTVWRYDLQKIVRGKCPKDGAIVELGGLVDSPDTENKSFVTWGERIDLLVGETYLTTLVDRARFGIEIDDIGITNQLEFVHRSTGTFWLTEIAGNEMAVQIRQATNHSLEMSDEQKASLGKGSPRDPAEVMLNMAKTKVSGDSE